MDLKYVKEISSEILYLNNVFCTIGTPSIAMSYVSFLDLKYENEYITWNVLYIYIAISIHRSRKAIIWDFLFMDNRETLCIQNICTMRLFVCLSKPPAIASGCICVNMQLVLHLSDDKWITSVSFLLILLWIYKAFYVYCSYDTGMSMSYLFANTLCTTEIPSIYVSQI